MAGISTGRVKSGVTFTGQHEMGRRMKVLSKAFPILWSEALFEEGKAVLKEAQDKYVPIETEALKDSGRTILIPTGVKTYLVDVEFGNTPETRPYAVAVHEHPSSASPPSWQPDKKIQWSKAGTGAKYLEKPMRKARAKMPVTVAARVMSRMPQIPGAFTFTG